MWEHTCKAHGFLKDIVEQLTLLTIVHFGGSTLIRISQLFDNYVDALIKALPSPSEDDSLTEVKEAIPYRAETDSQQFALLGTAFTVADDLLPMVVSRIWSVLNEIMEAESALNKKSVPPINNLDFKEWRRHIQRSLDKLRDHFCRQYVLNFIYSRDGETRLDAEIYLNGEGDDLVWDSDPLPSLPFQALFGKLQQLATVAGDVLLGKEKIQKVLLARLTETVVIWLSDEHEFWGVLEDKSARLQSIGLQQLILDMHFTLLRNIYFITFVKTWQGGKGYARNIAFERILCQNSDNPITINQFYCDHETCVDHNSAVKVSGITFREVMGTSKRETTVMIDCSKTVPCEGIAMENVYLKSNREGKEASSYCSNGRGRVSGWEFFGTYVYEMW